MAISKDDENLVINLGRLNTYNEYVQAELVKKAELTVYDGETSSTSTGSIGYTHPDSGVIPGIYDTIIVDKYGHVTYGNDGSDVNVKKTGSEMTGSLKMINGSTISFTSTTPNSQDVAWIGTIGDDDEITLSLSSPNANGEAVTRYYTVSNAMSHPDLDTAFNIVEYKASTGYIIQPIATRVAPTEYTLDMINGANASTGGCHYFKQQNGVVTVTINANVASCNLHNNGTKVIATLPIGYRPDHTIIAPALIGCASTSPVSPANSYVSINTDGDVTACASLSNTTYNGFISQITFVVY